jgi:hypothetical protein
MGTTNQIELDGIKAVQQAINYMHAAPVSLLLVLALVVFGAAIRVSHALSNRWAPVAILGLGIGLNVFFGDVGKVDPAQRNPRMVLGLYGCGLGTIALGIYGLVGKRVERLFKQFDENETIIITKETNNDIDPKT